MCHNATQCNNTLHRTVAHCDTLGMLPLSHKCVTTQHNATTHHITLHILCKSGAFQGFSCVLQCVAVCCYKTHLSKLHLGQDTLQQHTATMHCNTLQHTVTHLKSPLAPWKIHPPLLQAAFIRNIEPEYTFRHSF